MTVERLFQRKRESRTRSMQPQTARSSGSPEVQLRAGPHVAAQCGAAMPWSDCDGATGGRQGIVNLKVLPLPNSLSTQIRPPCASTTILQKVSPRPVDFCPVV